MAMGLGNLHNNPMSHNTDLTVPPRRTWERNRGSGRLAALPGPSHPARRRRSRAFGARPPTPKSALYDNKSPRNGLRGPRLRKRPWKCGAKPRATPSHGHIFLENVRKGKYVNRKRSGSPVSVPPSELGGPGERPGRGGRARRGRGRRGDRGPRAGGAAHARREFPHLDEPAEDAEEPVLAVHRAPYAVSPGPLLLVLVPGRRRRRRGVTVHDLAAAGLQGAAPEAAGGGETPSGARGPGAALATAPPAAQSPAGLSARPILPSGIEAQMTPSLPLPATLPGMVTVIIVIGQPHWTVYFICYICCAGLYKTCSFCHMTSAPQ